MFINPIKEFRADIVFPNPIKEFPKIYIPNIVTEFRIGQEFPTEKFAYVSATHKRGRPSNADPLKMDECLKFYFHPLRIDEGKENRSVESLFYRSNHVLNAIVAVVIDDFKVIFVHDS